MSLTDFELVREALGGSTIAFDELMRRYEKLVYRIAFGFGKNNDNSMDITQNVFLKTYEKLHSFKMNSSFKTWITRIAFNEGVNWTRKNRHSSSQELFDEGIMNYENKGVSQEDEFLARENKSQLIQSLFALNTRYRLAVVLRYFEDMPVKEIAGVLECSEGVVKSMLFRSLQRLKNNLRQSDIGDNYGQV